MEAILLAGGFGTRMRPLTYTRPKPLLPVANRTMIERALDLMPKTVDKVVLPVNYLGDLIRAHFEDNPDPRLVIVEEKEPAGTGGAIKNVEDEFTGPFIVYNADIVSSLDLKKFSDAHAAKKAKATISLWEIDEPWHFGVVVPGKDGAIKQFVEKPPKGQEPSRLVNAGHYMLDLSVLDAIPKGRFVSLEREVFTPMAPKGGLYGFPFQGYWIDCGRPETYLEAHRATLAQTGRKLETGKGVKGLAASKVASYAIGDGCRIGKNARVERSVLLNHVTLGKDTVVKDTILGEGVEVEDGAVLENCVVGDHAIIEAGRTIRGQRVGMKPQDIEKVAA